MKLINDDDVRTMFLIFSQYNLKWQIDLDASLVESFKDIQKSLIRSKNYEEIKALIDKYISLTNHDLLCVFNFVSHC